MTKSQQQEKKYYMSRIWLHCWANGEEGCGRSPMGQAQDGEEGEAEAGWLGLALAAGHGGTSRRGRARSTLGTSEPLLIVSEEQKRHQGRPAMRARG